MGNVAGRFVVRDFHIYFHWHGQDFFLVPILLGFG